MSLRLVLPSFGSIVTFMPDLSDFLLCSGYSTRRAGRGGYNILTRLRSEPLPSPQHGSPQAPPRQPQQPQHQTALFSQSPAQQTPLPTQPLVQQRSLPQPADSAAARIDAGQTSAPLRAGPLQAASASRVPDQDIGAPKPVVQLEPEPDMSSQQALGQVAALLEDLASAADSKQQPNQALSLRLLAMQLLLLALGVTPSSHSSKQAAARAATTDGSVTRQHQNATSGQKSTSGQPPEQQHADALTDSPPSAALHQQQQDAVEESTAQQGVAAGLNISKKVVQQRLFDIAARADENALALKDEGDGVGVPYVWQLVYAAALESARDGAMQEIIGHNSSCKEPYSQVLQAALLYLTVCVPTCIAPIGHVYWSLLYTACSLCVLTGIDLSLVATPLHRNAAIWLHAALSTDTALNWCQAAQHHKQSG